MEIVNLYKLSKEECSSSDVVFVGRNGWWHQKKFPFTRFIDELKNPFEVGVHGERGECVRLYHKWLMAKIKANDQTIISAILSLKETDKLACFCPKAEDCRASIIIRAYNYLKGIDVRDK